MTGELHHHVRRDAVGEGETDEGLAAGMGADENDIWLNQTKKNGSAHIVPGRFWK